MPATILLDDAQQMYTDRLRQHAQNALQAVQTAAAPIAQAVASAPQELAAAVTSAAPQVDPSAIIARLQQHAQDALSAVQPSAPQIDPNDVTQRLQQHANDAFQAVDQTSQQLGQGLQNVQAAVQPVVQAAQQAVDQTTAPTTSAGFSDQGASDRVRGQASIIAQASAKTGVPAPVIAAIMDTEAGGPTSLSPAGAAGFMQIMPQHFKAGEDPFDPTMNITRGAEILADNYKRYGSWDKAAAAYFGSIDAQGNITNAQDAVGTTGTGYVGRFLSNLDKYGGSAAQPGPLDAASAAVRQGVGAVQQAAANVLPTLSQFGDKQLSSAEAYAACYDGETRVLSRRGFVYFRDLTDEDELATRRADGVIEYHRPLARQRYAYRGRMIHFKNLSVDLLVTPDHQMLVIPMGARYPRSGKVEVDARLVPAQAMAESSHEWSIPVHARWIGDAGSFSESPVQCSADEWAAFMGLWLAEGHVEIPDRGRRSARVAVTQAVGPHTAAVERIVGGLGLDYATQSHTGGPATRLPARRYRFSHAPIWAHLQAIGTSERRAIPRALLQAEPEVLNALLMGLWLGDGSKGDAHVVYTSTSKQLAEDVAELGIKLGCGAVIHTRRPRNPRWLSKYDVTLRSAEYYSVHPKRRTNVTVLPDWEGEVFCATVPNHTLLIERNGKITWCGNCGPAAAVRFSQMYGRNPTLREATDLAKGVGWTQDSGMAGLQSESKLFDQMGIPHRVVGADWQALQREAQSGNPVTISTPGHYFTADSYDPQSGAFHVGSSGTDLRGGSEWMTPSQMEARMGALQGGLAADNPGVPAPSPISAKQTGAPSGPIDQAGQLIQQGGQAIQSGLQQVDNAVQGAVQTGRQAVNAAGQTITDLGQAAGQAIDQNVVQPARQAVQTAAQNPQQTAQDLVDQAQLPPQFGGARVGDVTRAVQDIASKVQVPETDNLAAKAAGAGFSALGTVAREATDTLDRLNVVSTAAREAAGGDVYGQKYAAAGGPALENEYRTLLNQRMNGDDSVSPRMNEIANQLQQINNTIRDGKPQSEVNQSLSAENPLTPVSVGVANLGAAALAAPLAAGDAPLVARALAEILQPGTNPLEIAHALTMVKDASGSVPDVARAVEEAWQNFGGRITDTAAQRAQQIASMDDSGRNQLVQAITNAIPGGKQAISGTQGGTANVGFAARLGGAAAGGVAGYQTTPEDASAQERALRTGAGAVAGFAGVAAASKVARALSDILRPDIAAPQLEQAIKTINESDATAPEIIDQVRKMPGTAELAPVRAQVPQSSTDLLQGMLDMARAKGADPDKLAALEQQIAEMDPAAAARRALSPAVRGGAELAQASPRFAATLGGAAAGGYAGNATAPDDAEPRDRALRILAGAGAGAALGSAVGYRGQLPQQVLENLRTAGLVGGGQLSFLPPAQAARGPIAQAVDVTKQSILTNPATHIANVIGNTLELARQPVSLAAGGRGDDALAGLVSIGRAIPEAAQNAWSAIRGNQVATLAGGASNIPARSPIFRALSAADAFTRTLGEYQGMASEANRLLRAAGLSPSDPGAAQYLAQHAAELHAQGARAGSQSVFGRIASQAQGTGVLDNIFRTYSRTKEGLLASPRLRDQAVGALMDFGIPFSGVPVQMLQIGLNRLPVTAQASGAVRAVRALRAGNMGEAQRAIGETGLESALQLMIAKNVADGNITGPDDPDHPNSVRVNGNWVSMSEWGAYALPMQIMASWADGYEKGGQNVPRGGGSVTDYYGPRFAGAFNAALKPFQQGIPGENLIKIVSNLGQGGATQAGLGLAQDAINRITVPGAARFVENLTDPVARDINRKGIASLWQGPMSNWPGLAQQLPARIDPTTGAVLNKTRSGPGILVGGQQDVESPFTIEANRLKQKGYAISPPKTYPQAVTIGGAAVQLKPDEQRAVTQITGATLDKLAQRLNTPEYQNATDNRKALMLQAMLNATDNSRVAAVGKVLGRAELRQRVLEGQRTAGRLNAQAAPPSILPEDLQFDPLSGLTAQDQRTAQLAGSR